MILTVWPSSNGARRHIWIDYYRQFNEGIDGINTAVEESAQGVTMVADNTSQLVEMLGSIKSDAESNRAISDELSSEVQMFKHI